MFLNDAHGPQFLKDASVVARLHLFPVGDGIDILRQHEIGSRDFFINRRLAGVLVRTVSQLAEKG